MTLTLDLEEKLVLVGFSLLAALTAADGALPSAGALAGALAAGFLLLLPLPVVILRSGRRHASAALRRCAPAIGAILVYEALSSAHGHWITRWLGIPSRDAWMVAADRALLGAELPERLVRFASGDMAALARSFAAWAPLLAVVTAILFAELALGDARLVLRLRRALVFVLFAALALHLVVPVAGPRFIVDGTRDLALQSTLHRRYFQVGSDVWDGFPAVDVALVTMVVAATWRTTGAMRAIGRATALVLAALVAVCGALGARHYGVDLLAGTALGAGAVAAGERFAWGPTALALPGIRGLAKQPRPVRVLALLFTATGAAALLSEQAFEKLLGAMLGASTPSVAIVLSVYFVGLTLGAAVYGLASRRIARPLAAYAVLEAGVAVWAVLLCTGYEALTRWSMPILLRAAESPFRLEATRALVASAWMLPPTILMGASFPAVVDTLEAMRAPSPRRTMSAFYALNLLGAVAAAVAGPYVTFPRLGVDGTLLAAAAIDAVACAAALFLDFARKWTRPPPVAKESSSIAGRGVWLLAAAAFLSGFLLFSLEVLWTHLLSATIGNSVYSFAAMLGLVLLGLCAGSVVSTRVFGRDDAVPSWVLAAACVFGGLVLALEEPRWPAISGRLAIAGPLVATFGASECLRWFHAGLQILPTATVLGLLYPTLFRLREFREAGRASLLGGLAATNAAGCCAGALLTAFVAIPRLGSQRSIDALAITCSVLGAALAIAFSTGALRRTLVATAGAVIVFILALPRWDRLALTAGTHVYLKPMFVLPDTELEFFHEDAFGGITTVVGNPGSAGSSPSWVRTLLTNGKFQGNDAGETDAQLGFALLPILHARHHDRACVIGLGTGQSARVFADLGFSNVDVAEIAPGIVSASPYFARINGDVLGRPNVHLWLEDGRTLLSLHPTLACDVISMEISSVWFAGSTNLYSREFYEIAKERLSDAGILQQWIQVHHIGVEDLGTVLATVRSVFPHVTFWVFGSQGIIVASSIPLQLSTEGAAQYFAGAPALGLDRDAARDLFERALASRLLSEEDVTRLASDPRIDINSDRNRHLEYASARHAMDRAALAARNVDALGRLATFSPLAVARDYPADERTLVDQADASRAGKLARGGAGDGRQGPPGGPQ